MEDLSLPSVLVGVATLLAQIHNVSNIIPSPLPHLSRDPMLIPICKRYLESAIELLEADTFGAQWRSVLVPQLVIMLSEELPKMGNRILSGPRNILHDVVFCHMDIQENNILKDAETLRLIDFEYSAFCNAGLDIGNYLCEAVLDYTHDAAPFFLYRPEHTLTDSAKRLFLASYVSAMGQEVSADSELADQLLATGERFELAAGMLWAPWSVIRQASAPTTADFDFLEYGKTRLGMYWSKLEDLMQRHLLP
eukprot:Polyplicarium_translucidae@DN2900_c0_g1_i10.p1